MPTESGPYGASDTGHDACLRRAPLPRYGDDVGIPAGHASAPYGGPSERALRQHTVGRAKRSDDRPESGSEPS